ncbi:hypothetical protein FT663_04896 [Candidozyma haemuli var. vulneris]|uniref:Protein YIF1 n=1 Tax=Candidozyma haemuli TaxID=45357 RepID=A0A2V1APC1_9ASCO|nr:hypothetical protein CXQ85_001697 [[Candida] haemuloni]KAF3986412.1 hypothetical protein FT663_04896 [[Candida] haemuloni var. vulneris]KAF3987932.1 hypothetical protein FT662_03703 [[Candida] haemuloni var. vulneris]PVH19920.1 hypothetical protein CXQ85_001697 [[Candida] haemuloni]
MSNPYAYVEDDLPQQQNLRHPQPQHVGYSPQQHHQQPHQQYQQFAGGPQFVGQQQQFAGSQQFGQQPNAGQFGGIPGQGGQFPQGQHQQHAGNAGPYASFFSDPTASMAAQFAKTSFGQSNEYIQQNFGSYIPVAGELKFYFNVSNSYVLNKIILILFPYRQKNWARITQTDPTPNASAGSTYAPPSEDVNAPDLYIPLMSFITYILLWSSFSGLKGEFHPELFGYLASQTLACSFLDILIFKVGLYLLNCSTQSSLWDVVSFSGYKYVAITLLLCWKNIVGNSWLLYYSVLAYVVGSLSLFLMRSLKFLVLPLGVAEASTQTITNVQRRLRVQFLFLYAVVIQFLIVLFMSR